MFNFGKSKLNKMRQLIYLGFIIIFISCTSKQRITADIEEFSTSPDLVNTPLEIRFMRGEAFNHPSFAIWVEDLAGNYIETLYVTHYVATGIFGRGEIEPGKWKNEPGEVRRPASLPYWAHKRNIKAPDGLYIPSPETAVPDALTGATPTQNFILRTGTRIKEGKFKLLLEINQPWDSNEYWNNAKFPDDQDYFTSLQPALVYETTIDLNVRKKEYFLNPVGHSHPSGSNGDLDTNLSTITTARNIVKSISVQIQ